MTEFDPKNKIYIVTPTPMLEWMRIFVNDSLNYPDMVELVPSKNLNPESSYYYQYYMANNKDHYVDVKESESKDLTDLRSLQLN